MERALTMIGNVSIEGYANEYIFETIKKNKNFYEIDILNKWMPIISNSKVIFDIGSNIGNHSIYWATYLDKVQIYAFEPYHDNFVILQSNVLNNKLDKQISIVEKGVGNYHGYAEVKNYDESNMGGTSFVYSENEHDTGVEIVDLDTFNTENSIERVDFVKIDTEGFEVLVLQGMNKVIKEYTPDIWVEVTYNTYQDVINKLEIEGYVLWDIEQFNLFFMHPNRHSNISAIYAGKLLDNFFLYLGKTNKYYKDYSVTKQWLENRNKSLEKLNIAYKAKSTSLENLKISYETRIQKNEELYQSNISMEKKEQQELLFELELDMQILEEQNELLKKLKQHISKLETQNSYLQVENREYRRKMSRITDTWQGKMLIKCYRILKRIKNGLTVGK